MLEYLKANILPLLIGAVVGFVVGRFAGALFGL